MKKLIFFFFLISLLYSCEPQKLTLIEQFYEPDEVVMIVDFQKELEQLICPAGSDTNFTCFNAHFNKAYDLQRKRSDGSKLKLNSHAFIAEMDPAVFDLLFYYTAGQEKKSYDSSRVDRKNLHFKPDGKFMNFANAYCRQSKNKVLKEVREKSHKFKHCDFPFLCSYLYTNREKIDYTNEMDRLIYSLVYVIIDYNNTFMY